MKKGNHVAVKSKNGNVIKGRIRSSSATEFQLKPDGRDSTPTAIAYQDVESVRHANTGKDWAILAGVPAAIAVTAVLVLCAALRAEGGCGG